MSDALAKDIERAQEKLRELDGTLYHLGAKRPGAGPERFGIKRRISYDNDFQKGPDREGVNRRLTVTSDSFGGGGRRRVEMDHGPLSDRAKRSRGDMNGYGYQDDDDDVFDARPRRSLQSTVVMPSIETKSREEKIDELAKSEKKEVKTRNRRMFSNLLMGTLSSFQKDEKKQKVNVAEKKQTEKLEEIEKKLDEKKREETDKAISERRALMEKRREQERELHALTRKRALIQYAEAKQEHYRLLQNSIQTQSKPTIFFVPAKHSLRSLELLKTSQKAIQGLIDLRQKELERDLATNTGEEGESDGEGADTLKSFVAGNRNGHEENRRSRHVKREHLEERDDRREEEAMDGEEAPQED